MNAKPIFSTDNFNDLFSPCDKSKPAYRDWFKDTQYMKNGKTRQMNVYRTIGNSIHADDGAGIRGNGFNYTTCEPSADVIKWICDNMIQVKYDTIHFKVIRFDDCAAIYAVFGQIIGSWLLAIVSLDTLPEALR